MKFTEKVYALVARIPRGRVASYAQVAAWCGSPRAARAVGCAMASVPRWACPAIGSSARTDR